VRAEVKGVGHEAHLFVRVEGAGGSDDATLAIAGTFDRPIVDRAWRAYDVEVDVPQEAASLTVGAALSGNGKAFVDDVSLSVVGAGPR
jgi:erythromycin esterase